MSTGIGASLREAREDQGRSIEDAARALNARITQLRALEDEDFGTFGGDVYAKGFLRSYATHLGLDPQPLLDIYRREVAHDDVRATTLVGGATNAPTPRGAPPAWVAWVLVVVVVLAGVSVVGLLDGRSTPETASPEEPVGPPPDPAPTDNEVEVPDTPVAEEPPDPVEDEEPADEAPEIEDEAPDRVDLVLALEENSWMRVFVDGALALEETVPAGETLQFDGAQEIEVRFGNAGGVRVELNGQDMGAQGGRGAVVDVLFTPEGSAVL